DGTMVRDYLYVEDAVNAYLALAEWLNDNRAQQNPAFNFSSNQPINVLKMTEMIRQASGREDLVPIIQNTAKGEIAAQHLDSTRAQRELTWSIQHELAAALRATVAWYERYLHRDREPAHLSLRPAK